METCLIRVDLLYVIVTKGATTIYSSTGTFVARGAFQGIPGIEKVETPDIPRCCGEHALRGSCSYVVV